METVIHPTAVIEDGAKIGAGAKIGPFCTIGPEVELGEGCQLLSHVALAGTHEDRPPDAHLPLRLDRPHPAGPEI